MGCTASARRESLHRADAPFAVDLRKWHTASSSTDECARPLDILPHEALTRLSARLASEGWAVSDSLLCASVIDALRSDCMSRWQNGAFQQAAIGRGDDRRVHTELRNDYILWLNPSQLSPAQRSYLNMMEALRLQINQRLYLGLFDFEAQFAVYPPGHFYRKHLDTFRATPGRVVSCVLYLNSAWTVEDGGALRLFLDQQQASSYSDVMPVGGRFVTFLSEHFYHELLPARRERLSLTGWFKVRAG